MKSYNINQNIIEALEEILDVEYNTEYEISLENGSVKGFQGFWNNLC